MLTLDLCSDWLLARYADRSQVLALSPLIHQYPVEWVGQNWPTHDGNLEQILELKPDLVISGEYNAMMLRQRLQTLGIRVEVLSLPRSLAQVGDYERRFLSLLGLPQSLASQESDAVQALAKPPRLLLLGANGIGTGRTTFEHGLIEHAGWRNYLKADGYVSLDLEQLIADPPDTILWSAPHSDALANQFAEHPVLKRAVPAERWLTIDYWSWQCPGPWTWELVSQLQQWQDF